MFSQLKEPLSNLLSSQRFYFNNYEYYNDYEKIESKYKDDLSKVFFRVNRKTKGTIFYEWSQNTEIKDSQREKKDKSYSMMDVESRSDGSGRVPYNVQGGSRNQMGRRKQLGIQGLLSSVLQNFHEQNYSDIRPDQQSKKQLYQFVHLKYLNELNPRNDDTSQEENPSRYQKDSIDILCNILKKESQEKESYYEAIEKMNSFAKDDDQIFLERWNAFENFAFYYLDHQLIKTHRNPKYKPQLIKLYRFSTKVRFILERTLAATYSNSLFVHLPNLRKTNRLFHPLTMGLSYSNQFLEEKNGFRKKPKIVFLNLDGRETPYNLRYARNIGENLMYVSVFKEPSHHYKKNQKMENEFQSDYDTTFANISQCYSRLLINEAYPQRQLFPGNEEKFINKSKMLLFPMNSDYLRREYYKNLNLNKKSSKDKYTNFPTLETSLDVYFLFQTVIFEQIRLFDPAIIFVSYNGYLNISQEHWNQIIKNLTIIADHKVTLYVDFIDKLSSKRKTQEEDQESEQDEDEEEEEQVAEEQSNLQNGQDAEEQPEEEDDLDQFKVRNIQVVKEFIGNYIPFRHFWPYLEHQKVLNSILMFLKISSGVYSMHTRLLLPHNLKFSLAHRYSYLECLCKSKQLAPYMMKYVPKLIGSEQLTELYSNQGKIELKQNRKENDSYQKMIDSVILDFLHQQNRRDRFGHNPKLLYRLEDVLQEQQYENFLKYGSQEDHNPEYSSISNSVITQNRQLNIVHQYLKEMKKKLLLENLQTYRHKKVFYHQEESETWHQSLMPTQKIKTYKFYLYQDDSEEISFEKYTQIIFDSRKSKVYVINYKATDERHLILYGSITPTTYDKKFSIKVQIARESEREMNSPIYSLFNSNNLPQNIFQSTNQEQQAAILRKDLVFVNYSHCFVKNKLYLYWPQKWSIREQIRHKILGLKYKPQNVNLIVKVEFNNENHCVYQTLQLKQNQKTYVQPRIGCSSYELPSQFDEFLIFGGIQDNQNDFFDSGDTMFQVQIKDGSECFQVKPLPKKKEKATKQSSISVMNLIKKNKSFALRLRPKMNYRIEKYIQTGTGPEENRLIISGGFGREFTNYFNFFSYESYLFNTSTKLIESKEMHTRRLIKLTKPIPINRVGKFYMITNSQNIQQVEQNFSDLPKDLFAFEYRTEKSLHLGGNNQSSRQSSMNIETPSNIGGIQSVIAKNFENRQVHSFLDQRYRTSDFKFDSKKIYLCGFNRTVREKIYSKFWSPELYVLDGNQSSIVHISLKTEKSYSYNISNFLMPREEDIVSLCIDQDRLYVLSSSPVIHSIEFSNSKYVLYEGNLSNMSDIVNKHQLQMHEKFDFKKQKEHMLKYKTLYAFDQKIYLFGGLTIMQDPSILTLTSQQGMDVEGKSTGKVSYREDYILEKEKNKLVLKTRKVQSSRDSVQMVSPAVVKFNQLLYFYSIQMTETIVKKQSPFPQIRQNYKIKIEEFVSESSGQGKCMTQMMKFYTWDGAKNKIIRIIPRLNSPKFVCISKHEPFNLSKFKEHLQKAAIRLRKREQESTLKDENLSDLYEKCLILLKQRNQQLIINTLEKEDKFFKELINCIRPEIMQRERDIEEQELIKDLKVCYSLVNKLILERLIQRSKVEENQLSSLSSQKFNIEGTSYESSMSTSSESLRRERLVQRMQRLSLNAEESGTQYRFIVEDAKSSRKIRYIAIGPLANVQQLRFFRIRFRHDVSLCLNKNNQDGYYYHPTINSCEEIDLNDKFAQYDLMTQEELKGEAASYKEFKLYCQLKL